MSGSKWFTRGWTLQELLAPSRLIFYNDPWQRFLHLDKTQDTPLAFTRNIFWSKEELYAEGSDATHFFQTVVREEGSERQ